MKPEKMSIDELLASLPSRLLSPDPNHRLHQLVLEKFPTGHYSASYVCLQCKGKTAQYVQMDAKDALAQLYHWAHDAKSMGMMTFVP